MLAGSAASAPGAETSVDCSVKRNCKEEGTSSLVDRNCVVVNDECELLDRSTFRSHVEAEMAIFDFIEGF